MENVKGKPQHKEELGYKVKPEDMNPEEGQFVALNQVQFLYTMPTRIDMWKDMKI